VDRRPENFLKKFQKELAGKKAALFVSCGSASQVIESAPEAVARAERKDPKKKDFFSKRFEQFGSKVAVARGKYLEEKAARFSLQPAALGLFGGVYNYNKEP
jgi:menaquinone-dependent protoporphyrinogen IX oxidase